MGYKVHWIIIFLLFGVVHHNKAYMYEGYDVNRLPETHYVTSVPGLKFLPPYYSNYGSGENNQIILRCNVRSDEEPNFQFRILYSNDQSFLQFNISTVGQWERIDSITSAKNTINASEESRYSIGRRKWLGQQYTSTLLIRNTQASDSDIFSCRVNAGR